MHEYNDWLRGNIRFIDVTYGTNCWKGALCKNILFFLQNVIKCFRKKIIYIITNHFLAIA